MIELAIGAGLVALAVVAARAMRNRGRDPRSDRRSEPPDAVPAGSAGSEPDRASSLEGDIDDDDGPSGRTDEAPGSARPPSPRGLRVDDVLLFADDEMWLAGEIYLDEEGFALCLFCTPGSPRSEWLVQLDVEAREVALLHATDEVPGGVVPTELPVGGMRLSLRRRGHADVHSHGDQLPLTTERARYALLGGPGGRTLVVVDFEGGDRLALLGESVRREMLDLLPGGTA